MDKIICVGKNYLAHAQELGDAIPEKPVIFLKPPSVLKQAAAWDVPVNACCPLTMGEEVHPECEIVVLLKQGGYQLNLAQAQQCIAAVTLGLDMTLRVQQSQLKKLGHPWTIAKVFPDAAILAPWLAVADFPDYMDVDFSLTINGQLRQWAQGNSMQMPPHELIVYLSHYFPLCAGDVIFTGTPAGVAPVVPQDTAQLTWGDKSLSVHF